MFIKFIKDHPIGISKDDCSKAKQSAGDKLVKQKFAVEIKKEEFDEWATDFYAKKGKKKEVEKIEEPVRKMNLKKLTAYIAKKGYAIELQVEGKNGKLKDKSKKVLIEEIEGIEITVP